MSQYDYSADYYEGGARPRKTNKPLSAWQLAMHASKGTQKSVKDVSAEYRQTHNVKPVVRSACAGIKPLERCKASVDANGKTCGWATSKRDLRAPHCRSRPVNHLPRGKRSPDEIN